MLVSELIMIQNCNLIGTKYAEDYLRKNSLSDGALLKKLVTTSIRQKHLI